ncbi:MAG: MFS transporter [Polyangiaceae bacterium]
MPPPEETRAVSAPAPDSARVALAVLAAALGYFVDIYDLVLFSVLRVPSLAALGVPPGDANTAAGASILQLQLAGLVLGGVVLGVIADKRGRRAVVFGSILLYSLANVANAFVWSVDAYKVIRFVAGFGLAGELGAGITLVSELLPRRRRGLGTTIVASLGLTGALVAGSLSSFLLKSVGPDGFRWAYGIGGAMGVALLVLRFGALESGLFERARAGASAARFGDLRLLFASFERVGRMLRVIAIGVPIWFAGGVLFVFAPEIGKAIGLAEPPTGANTIFWSYLGVVIGDVVSGLVSQLLRSRRAVVAIFLALLAATFVGLLLLGGSSSTAFYAWMTAIGFATGYWVLFVTLASEQFGTNLRATVTTSAPNFVRGAAIPISMLWTALKGHGLVAVTLGIGLSTVALSAVSLAFTRETFDADLDRLET